MAADCSSIAFLLLGCQFGLGLPASSANQQHSNPRRLGLTFANNMKTTARILFILLAASPCLFGFDPAGPPPEKTIAWTTSRLSNQVIPYLEFHGVPLNEAVDFIAVMEIPKAYKIAFDCSKLKDPKPKITFTARDIRQLEALGRVAEAIEADIVISPGKVSLVPRKKVEQGADGKTPEAPRPPN